MDAQETARKGRQVRQLINSSYYLLGLIILALNGCSFLAWLWVKDSAVIQYEEIGVCNGYTKTIAGTTNLVTAGVSQTFVVYRIISIDNSKSSLPLTFETSRLYLPDSPPRHASLLNSTDLVGALAMGDQTVSPGDKRSYVGGHVVVVAASKSGALGASNETYPLAYDSDLSAGNPGIFFDIKKAPPFPTQGDCRTLPL